MTLQAALKEQEIKTPFKTLKEKEVDTQIVINGLVTGIKTPLDIMIIALRDGRESNQEDLSSQDNSATLPFNKGKARAREPWV